MNVAGLLTQLVNGLSATSTLFLLAVGLSLIFGVMRIVNFAHGTLYMLGSYVAWSLTTRLSGPLGFWASILLSAIAVGAIGALIEVVLLRRIYQAPELFQLLATFALTLIARDAVLLIWGSEDLVGPRAPGLRGAVELFGRRIPEYDLVLIAIGPLVLLALWLLLTRTRWGVMVRAATQDRDMVGALGVNEAVLFSSVFALGAALAGLGGALQLPREPANTGIDISAIGDAFVVVVVGGMGSIPGAYLAALLISEIKALCIAIGTVTVPFTSVTIAVPKFTLVAEFAVMAVVLVVRPWGLLGRPQQAARTGEAIEAPLRAGGPRYAGVAAALLLVLVLLPFLMGERSYALVLAIDVFIAVLFAASLHFLMGPAGMVSFGHAAYFGLGAYGAGLLFKSLGVPMEAALLLSPIVAALGAIVFGWFCIRLTGVYFAMLTLAFGQIVWSVMFQWDEVTGGSNGVVGLWPAPVFASKTAYYFLTLGLCAAGVFAMRRILFSPFGFAMRAVRDSALRSDSIGIDAGRVQWGAFAIAGAACGLAGGLYAFSKGSISPETIGVGRSIDGLVMVLLGGVESLTGPIVGAVSLLLLQDSVARSTEWWRAILGLLILAIVLVFPHGIAGTLRRRFGAS